MCRYSNAPSGDQLRNCGRSASRLPHMPQIRIGVPPSTEYKDTAFAVSSVDPFAQTADQDDQAHGFTGRLLIDRKMTDARLWSKAGWTTKSRHDAAYVETADGLKFVLVIFTENHGTDKAPIPTIAGKVIDALRKLPR